MRKELASLLAAGLLLSTAGVPNEASAQNRYGDVVVAESWYGKGRVTGQVRPGRHGWQVQLPGGTWIDCVKSCSETLRRNSVDFWESGTSHSQGDNSPGYFRREFGRRGY